jgi:signal transduction histidine kinase
MEKINILIVDDKSENIIAMEALLDRDDINLISTTLPNEALRIAWEQDISIALVDVQMPGMDGFELVEILKTNPRTKDILIIFVTAISIETKYAVKGLNAGAIDYLYKPLNPFVTSAKVDSFIQIVRNQREVKKKNQELIQYQKELVKAKELAEQGKRIKENFLANISHEIRTPINGIIGLANMLRNTELTEEQDEMVNLLSSSSSSLLGVLNDVLDLSKIEAGKFSITRSSTQIIELCKSIINLLNITASEKKINLICELADNLPDLIIADSLRLNQILMNLIGNAIKFTNIGHVKLKVEAIDRKGNNVQLKFSIIDTGIGIAKDNIDKIFEVFEQADEQTTVKFGGTGLGLSIVKNLAKLKGGILTVESIENEGSTFTFTNWYEIVNLEKELQIAESDKMKMEIFEDAKILLAEDNPINTYLVIRMLKEWNINVDVVENGQLALEKLKEENYNLILMDTYMPVLNGLDAIKLIRNGYVPGKETIPIINFSATIMEADKQKALNAGANDTLNKSFDKEILYQMLSKYLK